MDGKTADMRKPPRKKSGQGRSPRAVNGVLLDVRGGSIFLGWSEKTTRGMVERRLIPFRRLNSRIVFIRSELEQFLIMLPGCTLDDTRNNLEARR